MFDEGAFHFEWSDAIAGALDYIIAAPDEPVATIGIAHGPVAGEIPIAPETRRVFIGPLPVFAEYSDGPVRGHAHGDLAFLAGRDWVQILVEQRYFITRHRPAHRTRLHFIAARAQVGDDDDRLRLAVTFVDGQSGRGLPGIDDFWIQRFTGAHAVAEAREAKSTEVFTHEQAERGGRRAPGGDGIAGERLQRGGGIELPSRIDAEDARPHMPRPEKARPCGLGPAGVGHVPVDILRLATEPLFTSEAMAEAIALLGVQHHLRRTGGATRKKDQARIRGQRRFGIKVGHHLVQIAFDFFDEEGDAFEGAHLARAFRIGEHRLDSRCLHAIGDIF
ncbi:hypothetical protein CfE428DRAFT_5042 [Chthoniobacter flavus Ellin428]|uniref:Uncharacterized protein n=1 Tax=Chthoniobacter flavus Ellin428 TaxID=497964 RepID=B4D802_9BACT|nr:hypothetical protein CfE428DRAFT_5042 [Chthoniobacter flavus Ellin428]